LLLSFAKTAYLPTIFTTTDHRNRWHQAMISENGLQEGSMENGNWGFSGAQGLYFKLPVVVKCNKVAAK